MVTFGFSAFLKLLYLNDRPQRTEVKRRLGPPSRGGYDFHKSLRLLARRRLAGGEPLASVTAAAESIKRLPERQSAIAGLERLEAWRAAAPGEIVDVAPALFESPRQLFRVRFEPAFGLRHGDRTTAVHIWNTKRPRLAPGPTYAALALTQDAYDGQQHGPDDVGVLSLRDPVSAYLLGDGRSPRALAASLIERIEDLILGSSTPPPSPEERPTP